MSLFRRTFPFILLLLLALVLALWWQSRPGVAQAQSQAAVAAVRVRVAAVQQQTVPMRIQSLGTAQAWQTVTVRARVDGQLDEVFFKEGQEVSKGQLLVQLDNRLQLAQLNQAKAQLARDQALLADARADYQRYAELAKHGAINRQQMDNQKTQVAVLDANVQADQAEVKNAEVQLSFTSIHAPLGGLTGPLLVDVGNQVRANDSTGLVVIRQVNPIAVNFSVPDTDFARTQAAIMAGESIEVRVFERASNTFLGTGSLVLMDNTIDQASATLMLKARLENQQHTLWPGQTLEVHLILGQYQNALVIPEAAVQRGVDDLFVYVVENDDTVKLQPIELTLTQDGLALVSQGLADGQRVVVDGQYKLRPGSKIEAIVENAAPEAAT